jgi:hypothetical protein
LDRLSGADSSRSDENVASLDYVSVSREKEFGAEVRGEGESGKGQTRWDTLFFKSVKYRVRDVKGVCTRVESCWTCQVEDSHQEFKLKTRVSCKKFSEILIKRHDWKNVHPSVHLEFKLLGFVRKLSHTGLLSPKLGQSSSQVDDNVTL